MELRIQTIPGDNVHPRQTYRVSSVTGWTPCGDCWHRTPEAAVRHFNELVAAAPAVQEAS